MIKLLKNNYLLFLTAVFIILTGCQNNKKELETALNDNSLQEIINQQDINDTESVKEILTEARNAWAAGKRELAQAHYIQAYKLQPDNIEILNEMANVYENLGNVKLLELCYRLILEKAPEKIDIYERYGLLLIRQKKFTEAEELLKKALNLSKSWKVYNGLGIIADIQGKHQDARLFYGKSSLIEPNNPEVLNNIGYSFYMEDQLEKAQGYFLWAIKQDNKFTKAIYNYALTLARQKNYDESLSVFLKVMSQAEANNNTGYIAMKNGDLKKAKVFLKQAVNLSPKYYQKAYQNLKELRTLQGEQ